MKRINLLPIVLSIILVALIIVATTFLVIIPGHHANECYGRGGFVDGYLSCTFNPALDDDSWSTGNWTTDDIEEFPGVWCHQECKSLIGKDGEIIKKDCRTVCSFWGTNFTFE